MDNSKGKTLSAVLLVLASALVIVACFLIWQGENKDNDSFENGDISFQGTEKETVSIMMVGDIMLDRGVEYMIVKQGKGDFRFPFLKIGQETEAADILVGNLEGPVSDKGSKVGSIYSFRMDPKAIEGLDYAGFDVLLMANNHAFDYGREALEDTFERLKGAGMSYVGAGRNKEEAFSPLIKEIRGMKIAFLNYTDLGSSNWRAGENSSGIAWVSESDLEEIGKEIEKAKGQSDFLIVSLHAGNEYQAEPSPFQVSFARTAIDSGADLVVEHHPHIVQKSEEYKGKKIYYSLGNFVFDQGFSKETMAGQILNISLYKSSSAAMVKEATAQGIRINEFFQPEPAND